MRWREWGEVENECASHNFSPLAIFVPNIFTTGGNLTKFWRKIILHSFLNTVYTVRRVSVLYNIIHTIQYTVYSSPYNHKKRSRCIEQNAMTSWCIFINTVVKFLNVFSINLWLLMLPNAQNTFVFYAGSLQKLNALFQACESNHSVEVGWAEIW